MTTISPKTIVITTVPNKRAQLTVPKIISSIPRPAALSLSTRTTASSKIMDDICDEENSGVPRKRKRLTHLSQEEKMMRRKLKNRVAAQTARDRKKVVMSELEQQVTVLEEQNRKLKRENISLKQESSDLLKENRALRARLAISSQDEAMKTEIESGSAVSTVPLQKGQAQSVSYWMSHYTAMVVMLSLATFIACCKKSVKKQKSNLSTQMEIQEPQKRSHVQTNVLMQWWGPHQQNWNPSMNS